jgi:SAM-dependent methyltransferase
VAGRIEPGSRVVEVGSGTGHDAIWLAGQGFRVIGSDYCVAARRYAANRAAGAGVDVPFREFNMASQRSVLVRGARLSRLPGPTHVLARLVVDELLPSVRPGLWRFCAMTGRSGGRTFVEFRAGTSRPRPGLHLRGRALPDPGVVVAEVERAGGRVLTRDLGHGLVPEAGDREICRLEVDWT